MRIFRADEERLYTGNLWKYKAPSVCRAELRAHWKSPCSGAGEPIIRDRILLRWKSRGRHIVAMDEIKSRGFSARGWEGEGIFLWRVKWGARADGIDGRFGIEFYCLLIFNRGRWFNLFKAFDCRLFGELEKLRLNFELFVDLQRLKWKIKSCFGYSLFKFFDLYRFF